MMIKIKEGEKQIRTCEKHGDFEVVGKTILNKVFAVGTCKGCEADEEAEQKRKEDEERKALKLKILRNSGVTERHIDKTFSNYQASTDQKEKAKKIAFDFGKDIFEGKNPGNLFFIGKVGTGKTHLACAICNSLAGHKTFDITRVIDIVRHLKETWRRDSEHTELSLIRYYGSKDLLILDEAGIQFGSDTEKLFIFDIINARYENKKPTMIISNLDMDNLKTMLGQQAVDRLREDGAKVVVFDWDSERGKL